MTTPIDEIKKFIAEVEKIRVHTDEQKLLEISIGKTPQDQSESHTYAADFRIGYRYGAGRELKDKQQVISSLSRALTIAVEALEKASKHLDRLSYVPCEASAYTLDDDQFGVICHTRDVADISLKEIAGVLKFDK